MSRKDRIACKKTQKKMVLCFVQNKTKTRDGKSHKTNSGSVSEDMRKRKEGESIHMDINNHQNKKTGKGNR